MSKTSLKDRVAVITGAGGGLGRAYALELAKLGARVLVNDVEESAEDSSPAPAQKVVEEIKEAGGEAEANYDSVAEWESAKSIISSAVESFGKIDILVNNAGILRDKSLMKMEVEDFLSVIKVHLEGTFYCTKAAMPYMREQGYGRIVSASSAAGLYGNFGQSNYAAAKMGIVGLMNCVKEEGANYGILANTVVPTAGTRMTATIMPADVVEKLKPEHVAPLVAYLCSDDCTVNGRVFTAGGGYFSRAAVMEGPGHYFNPDREINADMIADHLDYIDNLQGGRGFNNAGEQTAQVLSRLMKE